MMVQFVQINFGLMQWMFSEKVATRRDESYGTAEHVGVVPATDRGAESL